MFRRESTAGGDPERYTVAGLWGSGNVVIERYAEDPSSFSMWDGHALFGPERPGTIEKFPVLVANLDVRTFVERYAGLGGDHCELWDGEEVLGAGCRAACAHLEEVCPEADPRDCVEDCRQFPRQVVECLAATRDCDYQSRCGTP